MARRERPLAVLAAILMVVSSVPVISPAAGSPDGRASADLWLPAGSFEGTVDIEKGGLTYFAIGTDRNITQREPLPPEAGFSNQMMDAMNRVPGWLRDDLMVKLREFGLIDLPAHRVAMADFDLDGDTDLFAAEGSYLCYYSNEGTVASPLLCVRWPDYINTTSCSPSSGDFNGDGRPDLIVGDISGNLRVFFNPGKLGPSWKSSDALVSVPGAAAPSAGDMDADGDLDLVVGSNAGKIYYFENTGNRTSFRFQTTGQSLLFSPIAVPGPACPAVVNLDGDGDLDLAVGAGNGIIHYFINIGTPTTPAWAGDDLVMFAGIQATGPASPAFAGIDGDNRTDLFVASQEPVLGFRNVGTNTAPRWQMWPFYEYSQGIGYYPPKEYLKVFWYGDLSEYINAFHDAESRIVDELAFSVANSPFETLRESNAGLYVENARSSYNNDQYLDYVEIVDYPDYSTARYTVNESGQLKTFELPRDIYYWYIVHPKITDEMPLYIVPTEPAGSPNESRSPEQGGRFWRDFIFFNADDAYPPDPATDLNGDGVPDFNYPKTMSPPILRDVLAGVKTLWNCSRYYSPGGFDDAGINNSRPFSYGDHAIEKIGNWVSKTLVLREAESNDGERPIQPVRLLYHHNGNCGELQDLTVAAARAALIPALGANLLGEDHVWSEFYERGWHQWDNYWSDAGSIIDDYMLYWNGWGQRGGSGISGWRGDDYQFELTQKYLPRPVASTVKITVRDINGIPVDGARVLMASHYTMEQQIQVEGVSVPFPSIWNYTDGKGTTEFVLAHNNFTIKVLSRLGSAIENKTYIGDGKAYQFNFTLPGRMPEAAFQGGSLMPGSGMRISVQMTAVDGEQRPPNPETGTTSVQPVTSNLPAHLFLCDEFNIDQILDGNPFSAVFSRTGIEKWGPQSYDVRANQSWFLGISNLQSVETSRRIFLRIELSVLYHPPSVAFTYPAPGSVNDAKRPVLVSGTARSDAGVADFTLSVDDSVPWNLTGKIDGPSGTWRTEIDLISLPSGNHTLSARVTDTLGYTESSTIVIATDRAAPAVRIDAPATGTLFEPGTNIEFRGRATDDLRVRSVQYRVDGKMLQDVPLSGENWNFILLGGPLGGGRHEAEFFATDFVSRSYSATVSFEVRDSNAPVLTITRPETQSEQAIGESVYIEGTAQDQSGIASLQITIGGKTTDLLPRLSNGAWRYEFPTGGLEDGDITFSVSARDGVGNPATVSKTFRLRDKLAPELELDAPPGGTVFRVGDTVNVTGTATDNLRILRLEASIEGHGWHTITGSLRDGRFRCSFETWDLAPGKYNITVRAQDPSGNFNTARIFINIEPVPAHKTTPKKSTQFIPGMEIPLLAISLALALALRPGRRRCRSED